MLNPGTVMQQKLQPRATSAAPRQPIVRRLRLDASSGLCVISVAEVHVHGSETLAGGVEECGEERGRIPRFPLSSTWGRNRKREVQARRIEKLVGKGIRNLETLTGSGELSTSGKVWGGARFPERMRAYRRGIPILSRTRKQG